MIIAKIKPEESHEIDFDIEIDGSQEKPSDIRFVIEAPREEDVQDSFSIICRAVRTEDSVKVYIPKLLNLFKAGSYRAKLEVVLENRLFVPLDEEILIEKETTVKVKTEEPKKEDIQINIKNIFEKMFIEESPVIETQPVKRPFEKPEHVDTRWKTEGFTSIRNPFS